LHFDAIRGPVVAGERASDRTGLERAARMIGTGTKIACDASVTSERSPEAILEIVAAGIAHEVRNPLNALQLNVQLLAEELQKKLPDKDERVYALLDKLSSELRSLDTFVSEFLRYARPPALRLEPVPIKPLLTEFVAFVVPESTRRSVDLALTVDRCNVTASIDALQLKRAILNLVLNALQASSPGARVTIEAEADDATLWIRVKDTGSGISPDVEPRIFDVFFATKEGGSGLGLPIARRIAELHGGTLTVANDARGGAVATLEIPTRRGSR